MRLYVALVAYAVVGFLTFGHLYNVGCGETTRTVYDDVGGVQEFTTYRSCANPALAGIYWPVYWGGVAAIEVTK